MPNTPQIAFDFGQGPHVVPRPKANEGTLFVVRTIMSLYASRPVSVYAYGETETDAKALVEGFYKGAQGIEVQPFQHT